MASLFHLHPLGDTTTLPCTHWVPAHPAGHAVFGPCLHPKVQAHAAGDKIGKKKVPCIHWVSPHPQGDAVNAPCTHLVLEHPGGHAGPTIDCVHPLMPVGSALESGLVFFTHNQVLQSGALNAITLLRKLGVKQLAMTTRPINIFSRDPLEGTPVQPDDPFWSHYDRQSNSIQVAPEHALTTATLFHELGHAILGSRCVRIASAGGPHSVDQVLDAGTAMSEGWADFVGAVLSNTRLVTTRQGKVLRHETFGQPMLGDFDIETPSVAPSPFVELCVAACLWDLFDTQNEPGGHPDSEAFTFAQLFGVYSPTLSTLDEGLEIGHVDDYLQRLKQQFPARAARIDEIKARNVGP